MCEELVLKKLESEVWGFRLTGGRDFGTPLTVLRVTGASVAEESGMEVGDMIISINGENTQSMTHVEAQQHIMGARNNLTLQILRGSPVPAPELHTPLRGTTPVPPRCESALGFETQEPEIPISIPLLNLRQDYPEPIDEDALTEQKIAEKMLENAELLEGNVIGVNFKRFIPKVDFIKNSLVYQVLQEEQVYKEKTEEEELEKCPEKRFSTFLIHPKNPKPKLPPPSLKTRRPKTPVEPKEDETVTEKSTLETKSENIQQTEPEVKEELKQNENESNQTTESSNETKCNIEITITEDTTEPVESNETSKESEGKNEDKDETRLQEETDKPFTKQEILNANQELPSIKEVDEDISEETNDSEFNKQLHLIKQQLESLRQLPSLIETQLNLFQSQIDALADLKNKPAPEKVENEESIESNKEEGEEQQKEEENREEGEEEVELGPKQFEEYYEIVNDKTRPLSRESHHEGSEQSEEQKQGTDDHKENEHEEIKPKKKKSSLFNGITPQPRPVVLPGGRIWRSPKDAYNDEFIAETLITQAEVLIGTHEGVNFRKYEPPKLALSESAVWKLINTIENRSTEIDEARDFYKTPIDDKKIFVAGLNMNPDVEAVVKEVEYDEALKNAPPVNNHHAEEILVQNAA